MLWNVFICAQHHHVCNPEHLFCCPALPDVFTHSATVTAGETFIYSYNYLSFNVSSGRRGTQPKKFLCKGEDPTTCSRWWIGEPEVIDNQQLSSVTVTLRAVTPAHNGTYWCGAQTEGRRSSLIFYRLQLQVGKRGVTRSTSILFTECTEFNQTWG